MANPHIQGPKQPCVRRQGILTAARDAEGCVGAAVGPVEDAGVVPGEADPKVSAHRSGVLVYLICQVIAKCIALRYIGDNSVYHHMNYDVISKC